MPAQAHFPHAQILLSRSIYLRLARCPVCMRKFHSSESGRRCFSLDLVIASLVEKVGDSVTMILFECVANVSFCMRDHSPQNEIWLLVGRIKRERGHRSMMVDSAVGLPLVRHVFSSYNEVISCGIKASW